MIESPLPGADVKPGMQDLSDVASLVEIQPEATVSRTVLKAEGARVVLFSFDSAQVLTEYTAAVPVLLQVLDGDLQQPRRRPHCRPAPGRTGPSGGSTAAHVRGRRNPPAFTP